MRRNRTRAAGMDPDTSPRAGEFPAALPAPSSGRHTGGRQRKTAAPSAIPIQRIAFPEAFVGPRENAHGGLRFWACDLLLRNRRGKLPPFFEFFDLSYC